MSSMVRNDMGAAVHALTSFLGLLPVQRRSLVTCCMSSYVWNSKALEPAPGGCKALSAGAAAATAAAQDQQQGSSGLTRDLLAWLAPSPSQPSTRQGGPVEMSAFIASIISIIMDADQHASLYTPQQGCCFSAQGCTAWAYLHGGCLCCEIARSLPAQPGTRGGDGGVNMGFDASAHASTACKAYLRDIFRA